MTNKYDKGYPDDTIRYATSFVKRTLKVSDDILSVRVADHELTNISNEMLMTIHEEAGEYLLDIDSKYYYRDWIIRTRALHYTCQREILKRMEWGYQLSKSTPTGLFLIEDRTQEICDFLKYECGIYSNWVDAQFVNYIFTGIPNAILSKKFAYIKSDYIKYHWDDSKRDFIRDWIRLYNEALRVEIDKRWKFAERSDRERAKYGFTELNEAYKRIVLEEQ